MYDSFENFVDKNLKSSRDKILVPSIDYSKFVIKRKYPRFIIAISIISAVFLFSLSAIAIFAPQIFTVGFKDQGLESLTSSEYKSFSNLYATDNGLTLYAKAIVSDTSRTVIQVEVIGKHSGNGIPDLKGITLKDDDNNFYNVSSWGSGIPSSHSDIDKTSIQFNGGPSKETDLTLSVNKIDGVDGDWKIKIPVKPITSKGSIDCKTVYEFDNGISFKIDEITFNATQTVFHGTYNNYFHIDCMGPVQSVTLYDNGRQISEIEYNGTSSEFTLKTPPIGINDKIKLRFTLGIDHPTSMTKEIEFTTQRLSPERR